ncbi:MAG: 1-(5-phosphoribosyl)-5-[(5-phosphoribosylamino)methylideneamino]imidazole-4-carboxamide isomerase [Thermoleophilia bacterium]
MILYPAIDIQNGECVRLRRGDFSDATVFSTDPVERAKDWEAAGAQALHVVDLDGARTGKLVNFSIVEKIAEAISIPVQFGGGVRTVADLQMIASGPVIRIVIGTGAVNDESLLKEAVHLAGERLVVSVDADDGLVTTHGWQKRSSVSAKTFAAHLKEQGVANILYTDIERDGMMMGPNLRAIRELSEAVAINIIASGGISSLHDLERLKALNLPRVTDVIVGRALYEGSFTVAQARAVLD